MSLRIRIAILCVIALLIARWLGPATLLLRQTASSPPATDARSGPPPREIVSRTPRKSLPFLMQECGYRYGYAFEGDLTAFVRAALEPAQTGSLDGRFRIATTVYRIPASERAQSEAHAYHWRHAFGTNGKLEPEKNKDRTDGDEVAIQMALPFRLYKADSVDRENSKGVHGVGSVVVDRSDWANLWFLTNDDRLAPCTPQDARFIVARGGSLFWGENTTSRLIFRGFDSNPHVQDLRNTPYNDFDPRQRADRRIVCEIEIERLTYGPALLWQESWGFYRRQAMLTEGLDSDFLVNWNLAGAMTGMTPDYFRPADSGNPVVVSAVLVSAIFRTSEGETVASYHRD